MGDCIVKRYRQRASLGKANPSGKEAEMKSILCFGDSITWGYNPDDASRFPPQQRWPRILEEALNGRARIVEEGLNGRTLATDDSIRPDRSGLRMLPFLLESHAPLDLVIIMLGSNDCAPCYRLTLGEIALGCASLIRTVKASLAGPGGAAPRTLLIAPPKIETLNPLLALFYAGGEAMSERLGESFRLVADSMDSAFLDASDIVNASPADGVHLDPAGQRKLALAVKDRIVALL
jgi:lysophospholipase L1-like esterase